MEVQGFSARIFDKLESALLEAHEPRELLKKICYLLVQYGHCRMAVASLNDDNFPVAQEGLNDAYLENPDFHEWFIMMAKEENNLQRHIDLLFNGKRMGIICVFAGEKGGFSFDDIRTFDHIAGKTALKISEISG